MKIAQLFKVVFLITMFAIISPATSFAHASFPSTQNTEARIAHLQHRLDEIKDLDTKSLSKEERKALRGEVKAIKKEMAAVSGGVYLSVGAIILIALLLILLL